MTVGITNSVGSSDKMEWDNVNFIKNLTVCFSTNIASSSNRNVDTTDTISDKSYYPPSGNVIKQSNKNTRLYLADEINSQYSVINLTYKHITSYNIVLTPYTFSTSIISIKDNTDVIAYGYLGYGGLAGIYDNYDTINKKSFGPSLFSVHGISNSNKITFDNIVINSTDELYQHNDFIMTSTNESLKPKFYCTSLEYTPA